MSLLYKYKYLNLSFQSSYSRSVQYALIFEHATFFDCKQIKFLLAEFKRVNDFSVDYSLVFFAHSRLAIHKPPSFGQTLILNFLTFADLVLFAEYFSKLSSNCLENDPEKFFDNSRDLAETLVASLTTISTTIYAFNNFFSPVQFLSIFSSTVLHPELNQQTAKNFSFIPFYFYVQPKTFLISIL